MNIPSFQGIRKKQGIVGERREGEEGRREREAEMSNINTQMFYQPFAPFSVRFLGFSKHLLITS